MKNKKKMNKLAVASHLMSRKMAPEFKRKVRFSSVCK